MTQLKEVIGFYLGCQCEESIEKTVSSLNEICAHFYGKDNPAVRLYGYSGWFSVSLIKPILRPLSDMTEEEAKECWKISKPLVSYRFSGYDGLSRSIFYKNGNGNRGSEVLNKPLQFVYLLKQGFDLFGLHESGQCLYKTDIK